MIISLDEENVFYKIQHPFMIKAPKKLEIEGMYFNIIKTDYDKTTANLTLTGEKLNS
jgi:hypothetical protein